MNTFLSRFLIGSSISLALIFGYYIGKANNPTPLPQTQSQDNAVVWNETGIYEEIEDQQPITMLHKGVPVVIEDTACDFYFVRVESNNQVLVYGWVRTEDIRLYTDFEKGTTQ